MREFDVWKSRRKDKGAVGVGPVCFAGAGAEMRQALGTAVFFGMLGVTFFGLIFTPVFYVVIRKVAQRFRKAQPKAVAHVPELAPV